MVCFFTWLSLLFCSLFPTLRVKTALPPLGSWIADVIERGLGHLLSLVKLVELGCSRWLKMTCLCVCTPLR